MKFGALLLSTLIVAVLAAGCATSKSTTPAAPAAGNGEGAAKFVALDPVAKKSVTCTGLQETRLPDGRLKIAANLKNHENRRIEVQASCVFKDEQAFAIDEMPYRTVFLDENATETVTFESFRKDVTNYTVRVRQAR